MSGKCRMVAVVLLVLGVSCVVPPVQPDLFNRNPVDVLEDSPRIYRITFESFADSIESVRISEYFKSTLQSFGVAAVVGGMPGGVPSRSECARIEYGKAVRKLEAGAGRAAVRHLRKAIEEDPAFTAPYVVLARMFLAGRQVERAEQLLGSALSWDPACSEALVELAGCFILTGRLDQAKEALIDAIIFNRTNLAAWAELEHLGRIQEFRVVGHDAPELGLIRNTGGRRYDIVLDGSLRDCPLKVSSWIVYASQRAVWRYEGKYKQRFKETRYSETYDEDIDCYLSLAAVWKMLTEDDSASSDSEYLDFLTRVADEGRLVPHVILDHVCLNSPYEARRFSPQLIGRLREYVNEYVIVPLD